MRLVAITKILDEADVVEAFIRHTAALVDHHVVMDNGSRDGTLEILRSLAAEGVPLTILQTRSSRFREEEFNTALYRHAVDQLRADWVLFLDADEFIDDGGQPDGLRAGLGRQREPANRLVPMRNYLRTALDDQGEDNVSLRLQYALPLTDVSKVFVDARFGVNGAIVLPGAHQFKIDGQLVPHTLLPDVVLAHYVERSNIQLMMKFLRGWMKVMAGGPQLVASGANHHYAGVWAAVRQQPHLLWTAGQGVHGTGSAGDLMHVAEHRPLAYRGGPLLYTPPVDDAERCTRMMLDYVQDLAESHGRLRDGVPDSDEDDMRMIHPSLGRVPIRPRCVVPAVEPQPESAPLKAPPRRSLFQWFTRR